MMGRRRTAAMAALWIALPAAALALVAGIIGPCWELAYLALVTVVPAALALAGPWIGVGSFYRDRKE